MTYTPRTFSLPELPGLSAEQISVHLALYEGYVTHTNLLLKTIEDMRASDATANAYAINELRRRLGFEFCGMRMHEYYFEQLESGSAPMTSDSAFAAAVTTKYGSTEAFIEHVKSVAGTRGIGWVVVYADPVANTIHTAWVDDHQLGQLSGLPILLALDLWEHAFMVDYRPAQKKQYVEAFLENLNWSVVEKRFTA